MSHDFEYILSASTLFSAVLESLNGLDELPGFGGFFFQVVLLPVLLLAMRLPRRRKGYTFALFCSVSWTKILMIDLICTAFVSIVLFTSHWLLMMLFSKSILPLLTNEEIFIILGRVFDHVSAFVVFIVAFGISGIPKNTEPIRSVSPRYLKLSELCRDLVGLKYEVRRWGFH